MPTKYKLTICILLTLLSSCSFEKLLTKLDEHRKITVQPSPLEYHADDITFEVAIQFSNHTKLTTGTEYTLEFSYHTNQGDSVYLGNVFVEDALASKSKRITRKLSMPYLKAYESGEVLVKSVLTKGGQSIESVLVKVADGMITTHQLKQPAYSIHPLEHGYTNKVEYEEKSFSILFNENQATIDGIIRNSNEMQLLEDYIAKNELQHEIQIVGYHSPDKKEASSLALSKNRADAVASYIQELFQRYEQQTIPQMTSRAIFHDWGLFSRVLQESESFSKREKREIIQQIDGGIAYAAMDKRFSSLQSYSRLKEIIYPKVRQVTVITSVPKQQLTEAEIIVHAKHITGGKQAASELSAEELAFAAHQSPSLKEKRAIYEAALKHYTANEVFQNNLACVYLQLSENQTDPLEAEKLIEKAVIYLKKALQSPKPSPEVSVNLAAAQILKGSMQEALKSIVMIKEPVDSVLAKSIEGMKGYIYLDRGEYIPAIKAFTDGGAHKKVLYNKALAYLLYGSQTNTSKVFAKAKEAFELAIKADRKNSMAYYGAAITAARMHDEKLLTKYLKKAFRLNAELQVKARTDLEFISYRNQPAFKAAFEQ